MTHAEATERTPSDTRRAVRHRSWRTAGIVLIGLCGGAAGLRYLVHEVPWAGPAAADLLRRVIGRDAVTRLEEASAAVEDRLRRSLPVRAPRAITEVERPSQPAPSASVIPERAMTPARFRPNDVGAMDSRVAAEGDGAWRPVADPVRPGGEPVLFTTMLHPDIRRPWTEVFVVAADLSSVRLHALAGSVEPKAITAEGRATARPALVPVAEQRHLLAVFNGGFKTEHGQHGMFVDGVTLVPARKGLCTVVGFSDGSVRVATWETAAAEIANASSSVLFWRQAAPCMVEGGKLNSALRDEKTRRWGATLEGDTVIRRSAIGLDATRSVLYVAITNDTTATALAKAMLHAGASDVAQLDVNWSYPKFVLFPPAASGLRHAESLFQGFLVGKDDFVRKPCPRDFFYLLSRPTR